MRPSDAPRRHDVRASFLLVAVGLLVASLPSASAHPDLLVAEGTHTLAPGEAVSFPVEVHYHRLVGQVHVVQAPEGHAGVVVQAAIPEGGIDAVVAGPGHGLQVNALLRCCKVASGWSQGEVVVRNPGAAPVGVAMRMHLLHDGLAVAIDEAEGNAQGTMLLIFGVPSLVFASRLVRRSDAPTAAPRGLDAWARRGAWAHAAMWLLSFPLVAWGMARYGGGPVVGQLAATADLPATGNVILTTHTVLLFVMMGLWGYSLHAWSRAAADASRREERRRIGLLGVGLGLGAVLACGLWAADYATLAMPALLGVASAALPLGGGLWLLLRSDPAAPRPAGPSRQTS